MNNPLVINGWIILAHPYFIDQIESLVMEVESKNATKKLAAIHYLAFKKIPDDPSVAEYRQGVILGNDKHWFRAKFFQQYRLFFRFHLNKKIIIYAWVNDDSTKRAYGSKTDAYAVFKKMLKNGNPPNTWDDLVKEVSTYGSLTNGHCQVNL